MVSIAFEGVSKSYGGAEVIREFSAEVADKEFLVLLGPSGCGKSTMLRMIAGLTDISRGSIRFGEKIVNRLPPKQRNIAFVFQSYALYPHMSVAANIGFPLVMSNFRWWHHIPLVGTIARKRLLKKPEIREKIEHTAAMLELTEYLDRRPAALSGGQRQRVAVARSIVREPSLYLFDEPLSNLDAKLRSQMRAEITALHERAQKTFVYVTHDQVEAMTMGTQIIVLNDGVVQQHGTPKEIYDKPANTFVARFIGSPPMNIFAASDTESGLVFDGQPISGDATLTLPEAHTIDCGVRAERIRIDSPDAGQLQAPAKVMVVEHLGAETVVGFKLHAAGDSDVVGAEVSRNLHYARLPGDHSFEHGQLVTVSFDGIDVAMFDRETGQRIEEGARIS